MNDEPLKYLQICKDLLDADFPEYQESRLEIIDFIFKLIKDATEEEFRFLSGSPEFEELDEMLDERMMQEFDGMLAELIWNMTK